MIFFLIQSIKAENELENSCISTNTLIKIDNLVKPRRQAASEASLIHGYVVFVILINFFPILYWSIITFSKMLHDFNYKFTCITTTPVEIETVFLPSRKFFCVPLQSTPTLTPWFVIYCHGLVSLNFIFICILSVWILSLNILFWEIHLCCWVYL